MQPELHTNADIYSKNFPTFSRPAVIGYIGLENLMFAKCVQNKKVHFDLNLHSAEAIRKPNDRDVKLDDLLKFLLEHEARLDLRGGTNLDSCNIFCYRGLMTCVACTPYENREPWKIVAILFKGNIYLCARDTEEKRKQKLNMTEQDIKFTSWGYKFEQYMLSEHPDSEPNPDVPVDETKEFSLVLTTRLNNHSLVYGAEMDGLRCDQYKVPPVPDHHDPNKIVKYLYDKEFVELKTSRHIEYSRQETSFKRFKTKKWWCQSFLAGVNTIVCGFRDDNGIVEELEVFSGRDLVKMSERFWIPGVCFNFLDTFFTYVKRCLARKIKATHGENGLKNLQALPMTFLLLEWRPGMPVTVSENYCYEDDPIIPQYFLNNYGKIN
ncbi:decapping and exoribonuclease protein-like [Ostrinia nubilalis]|uniref:decapping and exoribonuclease protein-like n=1 Tax=Ostrinia nubilalis TaxID=29057 RepID=UPI00308235E3